MAVAWLTTYGFVAASALDMIDDPRPDKRTVDVRCRVVHCLTCGSRFSDDAHFCPFDGAKLEPAGFDSLGDPLLGSKIDGRYEVLEVLGEGGTGRVYKVRHAALNRLFAMKILRSELAGDLELAARFIQEAKATASVRHPNVVAITDFGHLPGGVPFLVTELLVGRTLGEVIRAESPMKLARAAGVIKQIAGALGAAHALGIVHRDLKPANVFLLGNDEVRVVDFGAAKVIGTSRLTREGIVFGTPHYMSPEQASGEPVDPRSDVYSLGVIMYEMLTGRVPFEADTYMGVLTQHLFAQPVLPSQVMPAGWELSALEDVALGCLAKKPEQRYSSMDRLAAEVDVAVRGDSNASTGDMKVVGDDRLRWTADDGKFLPRRSVAWGWLAGGGVFLGFVLGARALASHRAAPPAKIQFEGATVPGRRLERPTGIKVESSAAVDRAAAAAGGTYFASPPASSSASTNDATTQLGARDRPAHGAEDARPEAGAPVRSKSDVTRRPSSPARPTPNDDIGDPFVVTR